MVYAQGAWLFDGRKRCISGALIVRKREGPLHDLCISWLAKKGLGILALVLSLDVADSARR